MVKKRDKKVKRWINFVIFLIILFFGYQNQEEIKQISYKILDYNNYLSSENNVLNKTKINIQYNLEESLNSDLEVVFCPSNRCFNIYNDIFLNAKNEIKCAFYELDEENLTQTLLEKSKNINISLIIDNDYLKEKNLHKLFNTSIKIYSDINRGTFYNNYMHNKFCVIDNQILVMGSANPTINGFYKNNNNILKINSKFLAQNYENEFDQMSELVFGENKKSYLAYNNVSLYYENQSYIISTYMCPQDECQQVILDYLNKSLNEIIFALFTITDDKISNRLIRKFNEGINVSGIIESRNWNLKGSDAYELNQTFSLYKDRNKNNMHHKFFVIDERYVITGSMNPTSAGTNYNDENIIVIDSNKIAKLFKEEYLNLINS